LPLMAASSSECDVPLKASAVKAETARICRILDE
jgi:hypothetical protein